MKKLNLQVPINPLGYGVVGQNIAEALLHTGVDLHTHLIGNVQTPISDKLIKSIQDAITYHEPHRPLVKIWHQHDLINRIGNGRYYGFPIFELDTFSQHEKNHLKVPDSLIATSKWAADIIDDQCGRSATVVPLGVDPNIFFANLDEPTPTISPYKFFTIGKLEYRKGHDFIVDCFNKAFSVKDDVELTMVVNNVFLEREIMNKWLSGFHNTTLGRKINFLNPLKSHHDVADFIRSQDCGLFPSRAEGWNLELLESMACGKPVIATNYSAHTEFCNHKNASLIEIDDTEPAHDNMGGMWFHGQGNWAELDYEQEEQMIDHMRICYKHRLIYNTEGVKTAQEFTWDNTAKKLMEIL